MWFDEHNHNCNFRIVCQPICGLVWCCFNNPYDSKEAKNKAKFVVDQYIVWYISLGNSNYAQRQFTMKGNKISIEDINVKAAIAFVLIVIAFLLVYMAFSK